METVNYNRIREWQKVECRITILFFIASICPLLAFTTIFLNSDHTNQEIQRLMQMAPYFLKVEFDRHQTGQDVTLLMELKLLLLNFTLIVSTGPPL